MKLRSACRLPVSPSRAAARPAAQPSPAYAPLPPEYYADFGPPPRYLLALRGGDSYPDGLRRRGWYDPYGDDDHDGD